MFWNLLLYLTLGMVIAFAMQFADVMLVFNFLVLPAVTGPLMARSMAGTFAWALGAGLLAATVGFFLSVPFRPTDRTGNRCGFRCLRPPCIARSSIAASLILILVVTAASAPAAAQSFEFRSVSWRGEVGAVYSTPYVKDERGMESSAALGVAVGGGAAWRVGPRSRIAIGIRIARSSLEIAGDGREYSAGSAWTTDLMAGMEYSLLPWIALRAGAGFLLLNGPDDVAPFAGTSSGDQLHAAAEAGLVAGLSRSRPVFATLTAQGFRLGGSITSDPIKEPGTVTRVLFGLRYGG